MSIIDQIVGGLTLLWQSLLFLAVAMPHALIIFAGVIALIVIVLAYFVDRLRDMRIP